MEGNFLKLYLFGEYRIGVVKIANRRVENNCCRDRIIGTVVKVYSTEDGEETEVADCGEEILTAGTLPNS